MEAAAVVSDELADVERYGTARCVYAAAHGAWPQDVDDADGGLEEVVRLIDEGQTRVLAKLLDVEADDDAIADKLHRLRAVEKAAAAYIKSCLCNGGTEAPELNADIGAKWQALADALNGEQP